MSYMFVSINLSRFQDAYTSQKAHRKITRTHAERRRRLELTVGVNGQRFPTAAIPPRSGATRHGDIWQKISIPEYRSTFKIMPTF